MIASATDRELSKYAEYLKAENQILRARIPGQIHKIAGEGSMLRYVVTDYVELPISAWPADNRK